MALAMERTANIDLEVCESFASISMSIHLIFVILHSNSSIFTRQAEGHRDRSPSSEREGSAAPLNSPSSSRNHVRQVGRPSGENTSRLFVICVDGEGRGSKAFVGKG